MNFKGKLSVDGDIGDPLPVDCEVTDTRLTIRTRDGSVIGDWRIQELTVTQTPDGVVLRVDDEKLRIAVRRPEVFAKALRATGTSDVARRISAARESSPDPDRVRPLLAVGILAGLFAVFGLGLWAMERPPFDGPTEEHLTVIAKPPPAPATIWTVTTAPTVTATTRTYSTLEKAEVFWKIHLALWQEGADDDGGVIGYIDRAIDATHRNEWGEMAAECIVAQPMVEIGVGNSMAMAPTDAVGNLSFAFWEAIDDALYWCATGTGTAYSIDNFNTSLNIADSLNQRLTDAVRVLGVNIPTDE